MSAAGAFDPDLSEWLPWRPREVARLLAGVDAPWDLAAVEPSRRGRRCPRPEPERRRWLTRALELVHPGHRWLAELA